MGTQLRQTVPHEYKTISGKNKYNQTGIHQNIKVNGKQVTWRKRRTIVRARHNTHGNNGLKKTKQAMRRYLPASPLLVWQGTDQVAPDRSAGGCWESRSAMFVGHCEKECGCYISQLLLGMHCCFTFSYLVQWRENLFVCVWVFFFNHRIRFNQTPIASFC